MGDAVKYQVSKMQVLGNGAFVTIYTVNNARWFRVENIHVANVTNAAVTVQICLVPFGGAASLANAALYNFSIPANDFIEFGQGINLGPSSFIRGQANAANAINVWVSGIEEALIGA